jgi:hypothetical protein
MIIRFNELKARCRDEGQKFTLRQMADETGVHLRMLDKIAAGNYGLINPQTVDALWTFFRRRLPDLQPTEFIVPEIIDLPTKISGRGRARGEGGGEE